MTIAGIRGRYFLCLAVVAGVLGSGAQVLEARSADLMAVWLDGHPERLPSTLHELRSIPASYRSSVARRLTPELRSAMWREQLSQMLERADLSTEQRDHIRQVLTHIRPINYTRPMPAAERAEMKALCAAMPTRFPALADRAMFMTLASDVSGLEVTRASFSRRALPFVALAAVKWVNSLGGVSAANCTCNQAATCWTCEAMGVPVGCPCTVDGCTKQPTGCGCCEVEECNDKCPPPM